MSHQNYFRFLVNDYIYHSFIRELNFIFAGAVMTMQVDAFI